MRKVNGGGDERQKRRRHRQQQPSKWRYNENPKNNVEGNEIVGMVTFTTMTENK